VSANLDPSATSTQTDGSSSRVDLLEQLKAHLDPCLFAAVSGKFNSYEFQLQNAQLKVQVLEERLRLARIAKYGPGSEKLSNLQLELLEFEPGVSNVKLLPRANVRRCPVLRRMRRRKRDVRIPAARNCPPICPAWRRSLHARRSSASAAAVALRRR